MFVASTAEHLHKITPANFAWCVGSVTGWLTSELQSDRLWYELKDGH